MFQSDELKQHLETSSTIRSRSLVTAEWNMNVAENILQVGNYRYRPLEAGPYQFIGSSFDIDDEELDFPLFTGATDADIVIDGGFDEQVLDENGNQIPTAFTKPKDKDKILYSLEDCFGKFRPRSGINKLRYFSEGYSHYSHPEMSRRPRYYMASKDDPFKYWTSYRTENGVERGIANKRINNQYFIDDAAPYIVYNSAVPSNRIVVKMQTNTGDVNLGPYVNSNGQFEDPFYGLGAGTVNKTTPVRWRVQYLESQNGNWVDAIQFTQNSLRKDNVSPIVGTDGYVELAYGLVIPAEYEEIFVHTGEFQYAALLPDPSFVRDGTAYLVKATDSEQGVYHIAIDGEYLQFVPKYEWYLDEPDVTRLTNYATDLTAPESFVNFTDGKTRYREFQYIYGLRIVVETMNKFDSSFDLIEMSPRLAVDLSDKTQDFSFTKSASDLGVSGMPVGQLLASSGDLSIFDYDQAFFPENTHSIVKDYISQNIQIKFYEIVGDVNGYDYYIPLKYMYSEGFPSISASTRSVTLNLRDLFFYFETMTAPQILIQNASLSYAVSLLLDYVGFSNYTFKRISDQELVIPYFSIAPDKSVAEVLNDLALSSQSAMFFDEYNNFVVMSKDYMMPALGDREVSMTLRGSKDFESTGAYTNSATGELVDSQSVPEKHKLANIMDLASQDTTIYNDGQINYTTRYIQKSYRSVRQASFIDRDKTWIYKPALLWEITGGEAPKSVNDEVTNQSAYSLAAIPLNTDLVGEAPTVVNHQITNNVLDLGEGVYWLSRYNGFFFANGEVIKYDAVQYSVPGLSSAQQDSENGDSVWITSLQEYQNYFSKVPFNGKIYPTGLVRIYTEPNYETIQGVLRLRNGAVAKHGRGQFNTAIVEHKAGLSSEWTSDSNLRGVDMDSRYLFSPQYSKTTKQSLDMSGVIFTQTINRGEVTFADTSAVNIPTVITGGTGISTAINSQNHGLKLNDIIHFKTNGSLPSGITANTPYYVAEIVDEDSFLISATSGGTIVSVSSSALTGQTGTHTWTLAIFKSTKALTVGISDDNNAAEFTATSHGLVAGQPVFITTTGTLPTGVYANTIYIVLNVKDANTFTLKDLSNADVVTSNAAGTGHTLNILAYPAVLSGESHRFLPGDTFKLDSTGALPSPLVEGTSYYVLDTAFTATSFMFSATEDGQKITIGNTESGVHTLQATITQEVAETQIVVPTVTNLAIGMYVEKLDGSGELDPNTRITAIDEEHKVITINPTVIDPIIFNTVNPGTGKVIINSLRFLEYVPTVPGKAGVDNNSGNRPAEKNYRAKTTTRNGIIKNFLANVYTEESTVNRLFATQTGTIQSSAFVMNGSNSSPDDTTPGFVSYVYKKLEDRFVHFGTRLRIVGRVTNDESRGQSPFGLNTYYTASGETVDKQISIGGASGGIAVLLNPETNNGYYFEIAALTDSKLNQYKDADNIHNVIFYKVERDITAPDTPVGDSQKAIPVKLWGGVANILVDDGQFTGQFRMATEENPTVYDLAVEYQKIGKTLRFFLYINNNLVATVDDENPPMVVRSLDVALQQLEQNTATLTTIKPHGLTPGTFITASGVYPGIAGRYKVDSVTENTISYTVNNSEFSITGRQLVDGAATILTSADHGFAAGDFIKISGLEGNDEIFNGDHLVVFATSNTLTFALLEDNVAPGPASGDGVVQYDIPSSPTIGSISTIPEIAIYNNMALFVRGSSRVMFENAYAITNNYSQNTVFALDTVSDGVFGAQEINTTNAFQKYAMSGIIQSTYLAGISALEPPKYNMYFEEFGTIMREAAYFKVRYDKAYPALYAKISPTFNKIKGYTISGFTAGSYAAEFMIFNNTDTALNLDSSSGNYLRIQGITFTQQSQHELTVDEYFSKVSDLSNPQITGDVILRSPQQAKKDYQDIKFSRMSNGRKEFSIDAAYIQTQDEANSLMSWIASKVMKPRRSVGVKVFGTPTLQLGDIVDIDYVGTDNSSSFSQVAEGGTRFVIYNIEYSRSDTGPEMTLYLSEVTE